MAGGSDDWVTLRVSLPSHLVKAVLLAAEACGARTGPISLRLEGFVWLSEAAFERLSKPVLEVCGGAAATPERGRDWSAPAAVASSAA